MRAHLVQPGVVCACHEEPTSSLSLCYCDCHLQAALAHALDLDQIDVLQFIGERLPPYSELILVPSEQAWTTHQKHGAKRSTHDVPLRCLSTDVCHISPAWLTLPVIGQDVELVVKVEVELLNLMLRLSFV